MSDHGSLSAYARHRKALGLIGGTLKAVQRFIQSGRARECLTRGGRGELIVDFEVADREWATFTDTWKRSDTLVLKVHAQASQKKRRGAAAADRAGAAKRVPEFPADRFAVLVTGPQVALAYLPHDDSDEGSQVFPLSKKTARQLGELLVLASSSSDRVDDLARAEAELRSERAAPKTHNPHK